MDGQLDQQYGEAQEAFEAFVEHGEALALEGLNTSLLALASDNRAKIETTMLALADAVRPDLALANKAAFSAIFGVDPQQRFLTAEKTYLATAELAAGGFNPLPLNRLVADPDYKIYMRPDRHEWNYHRPLLRCKCSHGEQAKYGVTLPRGGTLPACGSTRT